MFYQIPFLALFAVLATAAPDAKHLHFKHSLSNNNNHTWTNTTSRITTAQILSISPNSSTCVNPPAPGECATAKQATPFINMSFHKYNISSAAEEAALVSLMAFETGDFKYNRNHFPGVPGQGTRNMQSPAFNNIYAASIPEIHDGYVAAAGNVTTILNLLLSNEKYDFGSAAWFLTSQCNETVRAELQKGTESGWEGYISGCVGTTVTDDRKAYWVRAVEALGVQSY